MYICIYIYICIDVALSLAARSEQRVRLRVHSTQRMQDDTNYELLKSRSIGIHPKLLEGTCHAIKGLQPPEHHAGQFHADQKTPPSHTETQHKTNIALDLEGV